MLAYSFQGKRIHPTRSYLRAFYRQAAPNFAYSFIILKKKFQPIRLFQPTRLLESWEYVHTPAPLYVVAGVFWYLQIYMHYIQIIPSRLLFGYPHLSTVQVLSFFNFGGQTNFKIGIEFRVATCSIIYVPLKIIINA